MLYPFLKSLLFQLDPEKAHHLILDVARLSPALGKLTGIHSDPRLNITVGNVNWTFPVGLAAGLDKNADALAFFHHQGFGAIECGTVTMRPQLGNPRPRVFRYPDEQSLRNAMGFPNDGLMSIFGRLQSYHEATPIGVNIGKNKETSAEDSIEELFLIFESLVDLADYFVINVSSPNTPGLRALQEKSYLTELFTELNKTRGQKDLYLKIAPDLEAQKVEELVDLSSEMNLTGIIATNTTIMPERGAGGISGVLLRERSRKIREQILAINNTLELIAVGGITDPKDLFDLWKLGGKAAQVYTAYIYQGPDLLKRFQKELLRFVKEQNVTLNEFFSLSLDERKNRLNNFKY